jgi:hypothetical protein
LDKKRKTDTNQRQTAQNVILQPRKNPHITAMAAVFVRFSAWQIEFFLFYRLLCSFDTTKKIRTNIFYTKQLKISNLTTNN